MGKVVEMKDVVSAVLVLAKTDQVTGEVLHSPWAEATVN
jgi:hypothetical protein